MIKEQINTLIKESMIAKDKTKTEVLRAVKTAFVNYSTQKNAKPLDDAIEIQIIKKMAQQREDTAEQYKNAGSYLKSNCPKLRFSRSFFRQFLLKRI